MRAFFAVYFTACIINSMINLDASYIDMDKSHHLNNDKYISKRKKKRKYTKSNLEGVLTAK